MPRELRGGTLRYWNNGPELEVIKFKFKPSRQYDPDFLFPGW